MTYQALKSWLHEAGHDKGVIVIPPLTPARLGEGRSSGVNQRHAQRRLRDRGAESPICPRPWTLMTGLTERDRIYLRILSQSDGGECCVVVTGVESLIRGGLFQGGRGLKRSACEIHLSRGRCSDVVVIIGDAVIHTGEPRLRIRVSGSG